MNFIPSDLAFSMDYGEGKPMTTVQANLSSPKFPQTLQMKKEAQWTSLSFYVDSKGSAKSQTTSMLKLDDEP